MRATTGRLVVAAFVAGGLSTPATAAPPTAFGSTTFTATDGGVAEFHLSRPATLHMRPDGTIPEITVDGAAGRMSGVVIAEAGISRERGAAVYAFRFNGCWARGCRKPADERLFPTTMAGTLRTGDVPRDDGSRTFTLAAGRYKAYVVGDGAPVTATVRFAGSPGRGRLAATRKAAAAFVTAESVFAGQPEGNALYSAGAASGITSSLGLVAAVMGSRTAMHVSTAAGACYYADGGPPQGTYLPGCPGGNGATGVLNGVAAFHHGVQAVGFVTGPNEWSAGVFMDGVEVREWVSPTALLWLSLN